MESIVISDGLDRAADYGLEINVSFGGDFAGDDHQSGRGESLAGHAAEGIFCQTGVEDSIRNLVGNLIGMAFSHGFGSEQITVL